MGQYLPSSRVNDGICGMVTTTTTICVLPLTHPAAPPPDCCDGSDESQHSSVQCDNTCEAVAEEYRRIQAERIRRLEEGARAKLAYVTQGNEVSAWLWFVFLLCTRLTRLCFPPHTEPPPGKG